MKNRLVDFVKMLHEKNIKDWDTIFKELNKIFGSKFMFNAYEAEYISKYYKGELNFNTKIIYLKTFKTV